MFFHPGVTSHPEGKHEVCSIFDNGHRGNSGRLGLGRKKGSSLWLRAFRSVVFFREFSIHRRPGQGRLFDRRSAKAATAMLQMHDRVSGQICLHLSRLQVADRAGRQSLLPGVFIVRSVSVAKRPLSCLYRVRQRQADDRVLVGTRIDPSGSARDRFRLKNAPCNNARRSQCSPAPPGEFFNFRRGLASAKPRRKFIKIKRTVRCPSDRS